MKRIAAILFALVTVLSAAGEETLKNEKGRLITAGELESSVFFISGIRLDKDDNDGDTRLLGENETGVVVIWYNETNDYVTKVEITSFLTVDPISLYMMVFVFDSVSPSKPMWVVASLAYLWENLEESVSTAVGENGVASLHRLWVGGVLVYQLVIEVSDVEAKSE